MTLLTLIPFSLISLEGFLQMHRWRPFFGHVSPEGFSGDAPPEVFSGNASLEHGSRNASPDSLSSYVVQKCISCGNAS